MTLTPDALRAAKGHLGDLADSIHAAYWLGASRRHAQADYFIAAACKDLTRLAAALGYRLIPAEGEAK